ncbi:MAG TPA: hypothetical protein VEG30_12210 [Terriglobales bacterium]|nr:hypothetical protein [Terriglobales bacterium]
MAYLLCALALIGTYVAARHSLVRGLLAVIATGYFYGIIRANVIHPASHFLFDFSVVGLYGAQINRLIRPFASLDGQRLRHWVLLLITWPLILFFVPVQDPLVQLVGLRGSIFLIPFLLVGAQIRTDEIEQIALWLSILNLVAFLFGAAEFVMGIEPFYPYSAVTQLIYRSNDVGSAGAHRIPAIFANAHAYGGTMLVTLPLIVGSWVREQSGIRRRQLLMAGIVTAMLGIFLCASRTSFLLLMVLFCVFTFSTRVRPIYRVAWLLIAALIFWVVSSQERLQRFASLRDTEFVTERVRGSVNTSLVDAIVQYPFGNGLGGGGTSMPFFLASRVNNPLIIESEIGRIQLETGVLGLFSWVFFLLWVFTRRQGNPQLPMFLGRRLAYFAVLAYGSMAFIGLGLFTSIPASAFFLMEMGWIAVSCSEGVLEMHGARGLLSPELILSRTAGVS